MQAHLCDGGFLKDTAGLAVRDGHVAVVILLERANVHLAAVDRLVEPHLDLRAEKALEIARALELPLRSRGRHLENIAVGNGVGLVEDRIERTAEILRSPGSTRRPACRSTTAQDFSRALDPILDEADPIPDSYIFEVSSAGAERQLKRPGDFERFLGAQVEVRLSPPVDGSKVHIGTLEQYDNGDVTVSDGKTRRALSKIRHRTGAPAPDHIRKGNSTMNAEFFDAVADIEKEKGIPREYMYEKIRQAMLTAFRKDTPDCEDNVEVILDETKKKIEMVVKKTVVARVIDPYVEISEEAAHRISKRAKIGDVVSVPVETKQFGRIAAQAAKQVIIQGIREAERGMIYEEFNSKEHEILTGVVNKIDPRTGCAFLKISSNSDYTEAMLAPAE